MTYPLQNGYSSVFDYYRHAQNGYNGYNGYTWNGGVVSNYGQFTPARAPAPAAAPVHNNRDPRGWSHTWVQQTPRYQGVPQRTQATSQVTHKTERVTRSQTHSLPPMPPPAASHSHSHGRDRGWDRTNDSTWHPPKPKKVKSASKKASKNQETDLTKYVPKLRHAFTLSDRNRDELRKKHKREYNDLSHTNLLKISERIIAQRKTMKDEKAKKERELKEINTMLSVTEPFLRDIEDVIKEVEQDAMRDSTRPTAANAQNSRNVNFNNYAVSNLGTERTWETQQQQTKNSNNNPNKRLRFDSPPENNSSSSSSWVPLSQSNSSRSTAQAEKEKRAVEVQLAAQDILRRAMQNQISREPQQQQHHPPPPQQQQQTRSSASPANTVQSTAVTSSNLASSPTDSEDNLVLPPYPSDSKETYKFVNYMFKFSVVSVLMNARLCVLQARQKNAVTISFTQQQLQYLRDYKREKNNPKNLYRVILRMSKPHADQMIYYDYVQTKVSIKVNGKPYLYPGEKKPSQNQPKPKKPELIEAPLDISDDCVDKLNAEISFEVEDNLNVLIGVYFIRLLSLDQSIRVFDEHWTLRPFEVGLKSIDNLLNNPDSGFADEKLPVSLTCPISKQRIQKPCTGAWCEHYTCFDLKSFLEIHAKTYIWKCPLCDKVIKGGQILYDGLYYNLLEQSDKKCLKVLFSKNLDWEPELEKESIVDIDAVNETVILSDDES